MMAVLAAVGLMVACAKKEAPAPVMGAAATPNAPADSGPADGAKAEQSAAAYQVKVSGPSKVAVEQAGTLIWELAAKPGFKVNAEYPLSFKPDKAARGITFEQDRYDLRTLSDPTPCKGSEKDVCQIKAHVPFKTVSVGNHPVGGVFSFSVCNEDQCLIEKVTLAHSLRAE